MDDEQADVLRRTEDEAERIRAEVTQPLTVQAEADGTTYLATVEREAAASGRLATAGRFGRRKARAEHRDAAEHTRTVRAQVRETWGEPPRTSEALPKWAARQAERCAEADPRVIDAVRHVEAVRADRDEKRERHEQERRALPVSEYGAEQARRAHLGTRVISPHRVARDAQTQAAMLRAEGDELRALTVNDAARLIEAKRAEQETQRQQVAERERQISDPFEREPRRNDPHRDGSARRL